jgi:hypothetical protein
MELPLLPTPGGTQAGSPSIPMVNSTSQAQKQRASVFTKWKSSALAQIVSLIGAKAAGQAGG